MVISESSLRSDLYFNDEDGITCLSNDEIFVNLALMGIDLVKPLNDVYVTPVHTKKVFTNMKRQNKFFPGIVTLLFASMLVPQVVEGEGEDDRVVRAATTATSLEAEQESGSGPRCQDTTLGDADAQTRSETASKQSHDLPLSDINIFGSRKDSMEHQDDLTNFVPPSPYDSPLSGGHIPGSDEGITLFKIGTSKRQSLDKENVSKQKRNLKIRLMFEEGNIDDNIDDMVDETMENVEGDIVNVAGAVNTATNGVSAASASITTAGVSISIAKPRTPPTTITTVFEDEDLIIAQTLVNMRKLAKRMHEEEMAEFETRQSEIAASEQASRAVFKAAINQELDDIQAMIEAYEQMASRLQSKEQEQFTIKEKSRMLVQMIAERKRFFTAQRAAEQRSKPPTKAHMRNRMCTYLKSQSGYKHNQLKGRGYDDIQKLFDKAYKQGEDLSYWKITRADGSFRFYKVFSAMLEEFDRRDLFDLYRLVMKRFESVSLEGYDLILWEDLHTMIEPNKEDEVWRNQQE
uniref:Uncharacterized protein n=1 Tax=Tanacetum cinerariifolium TaxID=118510 RepID=A0A6L2NM12_TANCI|nr:hypothetical protein [Tanacetum cinerariifolium]GEV20181.1 hypothetical protein [Tanacetum cinerariifolium]